MKEFHLWYKEELAGDRFGIKHIIDVEADTAAEALQKVRDYDADMLVTSGGPLYITELEEFKKLTCKELAKM